MGIINVTPDSFSGDGLAAPGRSTAEIVAAALEQARGYVQAGARILDVGAESTRPASVYGDRPAVEAEAEAALAVPVVAALARAFGGRAVVSIDTSKGAVARASLDRDPSYLVATARSVLANFWGARLGLPVSELHEDFGPRPEAAAPSGRAEEEVERVLALLPDNYRRVLELRFLRGYSTREVAAELGTTVGAVKVMQLRALRAAAKLGGGV